MATSTSNYSFTLPGVADPIDEDLWGGQLNANWTSLDSLLNTGTNSITRSESSGPVSTSTTDRNKTLLIDATSGAITVNLLAAATAADGFQITIKKTDSSSNDVTIDGNASETIDGSTTLVLDGENNSVTLVCDGSNWFVKASLDEPAAASETTAGIIELLTDAEFNTGTDSTRAMLASNFVKSLSADGYITLPGGLVVQWGGEAAGGSSGTTNFPLTFSSGCHTVVGVVNNAGGANGIIFNLTASPGTSSFSWDLRRHDGASPSAAFFWIAIGE